MNYDLRLTDRSSIESVRATAAFAERHGMATLWSADTVSDPFLALAIAAQETHGVQIGTAIAVAFARSPFSTALMSWDLQRWSEGRFILGLGSQVRAHIERRFGVRWHGGVTQLREYVACLRNIFARWQAGEAPDYRGDIYRCELSNPEFQPAPLPDESAYIPIWIGAVGLGMAQLAGEVADGVQVHAFHTPEYLRDAVLPALGAGRKRADGLGSLELSCPVFGGVTYDDHQRDELCRETKKHIAFYGSTRAYLPVLESADCAELQGPLRDLSRQQRWREMADMIPDTVVDRFAIFDEPERLGARLAERYDGILTQLSLYRGMDRFIKPDDWSLLLSGLGGGPARPSDVGHHTRHQR